mgnify:CR=1 FL=1
MKNENYAALVALDWGDKTHAFARQPAGSERIEQGQIEANPEALHAWLEQLGQTWEALKAALHSAPVEAVDAQALRQKIIEAFEQYRDWFVRPFGEGSQRWALAGDFG